MNRYRSIQKNVQDGSVWLMIGKLQLKRQDKVGFAPRADMPTKSAFDPQQTLLPRRTGILPFRFRLPLNRQLLRFGDLCRGHLLRDAISIADRILVTSRSRQTEPHVCLNIVLRHA